MLPGTAGLVESAQECHYSVVLILYTSKYITSDLFKGVAYCGNEEMAIFLKVQACIHIDGSFTRVISPWIFTP